MRWKIPIASKMIVLTVLILLAATIPIAIKSSQLFEKVSLQREEYANLTTASAKATEVENMIVGLLEKSRGYAGQLMKHENIDTAFEHDKSVRSVEIYQLSSSGFVTVEHKSKMSVDELARIRKLQNFPFGEVFKGVVEIRNGSIPRTQPVFSIGFPLVKDAQGHITHIAVVDFDFVLIQKPFSEKSERVVYLIDQDGTLLAHSNEDRALARHSMKDSPIVEKALKETTPKKQSRFFDPDFDESFVGAYAKTSYGVTVVAQTSQTIILEPALEVKRQAIFITGIVLSAALFFIFIFSMSLTSPIEKLAGLIALVSKGNFNVNARQVVKSYDEVGELAVAFDQMTEGLKERDKVKNLFSKFHGSSVAEDLLQHDIGVGGQNKQVTVFFSDIRGFTAFSENKTPEQVVNMLNEYFATMVSIINKHGGVVDKFIGDAIMAIWGAPKSSGHDAHNAVMACIEMRKALADLNALRTERGDVPIKIGMGLHSGRAIAGTIGSDERMEYTVIGDTVNMASRIEASTKAFGADLLISDEVAHKVEKEFGLELAGSAEVKGKSEPLKLFKVRSYRAHDGNWVEVRTAYSDYTPEHADKVKVAS